MRSFFAAAMLVVSNLVMMSWLGDATAGAAEITLEPSDSGIRVLADGEPFTNYVFLSGTKPMLWPVIGPTGKAMTRAYPMEKIEGERFDHPHHRSLWFTHGNVNGVDFWGEAARKQGRIVHREVRESAGGDVAVLVTANDWIGPDGERICEDVRRLTFSADASTRTIDFEITITGVADPTVFGDTKEGTFGVRVPTEMDVDRGNGGRIVNSEGQTDKGAWGKPAAWVDYHGPVDGETLGIAILNHPSSFRFPSYWHVRTYGLFAANPFGLHDFLGTSEPKGEHSIAAGESMTLRYRVIFHEGDAEGAGIGAAYARYAAMTFDK